MSELKAADLALVPLALLYTPSELEDLTSVSPSVKAALERIVEDEGNAFRHNPEQKLSAYFKVTNRIRGVMDNLSIYGQDLFEDGEVPADVYGAALLDEIGDEDLFFSFRREFDWDEEALGVREKCGVGLYEAAPEVQALFYSYLLRDLRNDLLNMWRHREEVEADPDSLTGLDKRFLYQYYPTQKNLIKNNAFERQIHEATNDVAAKLRLDMLPSSPVRIICKGIDVKAKVENPNAGMVEPPDIEPKAEHAHILYDVELG